jgi:hypothetical protein
VEFEEHTYMEIITGIIIGIGILVIGGFLKWLANIVIKESRETRNEIKYIGMEIQATDYAIEQSLKNGYSKHRKEKLEELVSKCEFIKGEKQ